MVEIDGATRKDNTSNNNIEIWGTVGRMSFCTWILVLMSMLKKITKKQSNMGNNMACTKAQHQEDKSSSIRRDKQKMPLCE